ncbi:hypothetical protein BGZ61DRAFT_492132 [Ilyonectria robusta]|uniref:uncharacterized protein n=1 Tax=Ilyonectria robusta TaxID=1079257 RepID=UPI001E8DD00E|nr:uncharacterized protein BGZ61DRAFT_492132 [Ilyonectria robusta]KAH8721605.1 hypothetical protein BGZ61DRAFT_492132 [Ilyonectria robusta]
MVGGLGPSEDGPDQTCKQINPQSINANYRAIPLITPSTTPSNLNAPLSFDLSNTNREKDSSGCRFWLCKDCHKKKATITYMYDAASTSQANGHIEDVHRINQDGPISLQRKKQRTLFDMANLDSSFDPVTCDNVPFNKLESPYFRKLIGYANSAIIESGSLPTHTTIRVVTEILGRSLGRINISFNA